MTRIAITNALVLDPESASLQSERTILVEDDRYIEGPRLIFGGRALSQIGGHGEHRPRGRTALESGYAYTSMSAICDGVAEVRRAVREEIKRGAHHIKLMLSGGVA